MAEVIIKAVHSVYSDLIIYSGTASTRTAKYSRLNSNTSVTQSPWACPRPFFKLK